MSELRPILPKTTTIIPLSNNDICVTSLIKEKIREYMMKGQAKEVDPSDEASPIKKTNEYSTLIRKHSLPATSTRPLETPSTRPLETPSSSAKPCPPPLVPRRPVAILRPVDTSTEEEEMFVGSTTGDEEVEEEIVEVGEEEEESDEFDDAIDR
ncbi:hypothetical protein M8J75_004758 [Diaphorina citri]|nr:hypothetical protein M8J75_004758 [Diaphorina citri]